MECLHVSVLMTNFLQPYTSLCHTSCPKLQTPDITTAVLTMLHYSCKRTKWSERGEGALFLTYQFCPYSSKSVLSCSLLSALRINNQQDATSIQNFILSRNTTCFGHLLCPSSGVISCTRGNWYVSCRLCGRCLGRSGSNLTLPGSGHVTCMKHTNCHV
jgi:hypothetical protein